MLKHLYIKNYALIDELDIDLFSGFSVITGETGAGKSIILGAIGLLLGQRADSKSVKTDRQKCTIEVEFDLSKYQLKEWFEANDLEYDDTTTIIRREITTTGKSRGFINDTPVTLIQMRELGEMLIDVHSQHQNLLLQKEDFQLKVIDIIASNATKRNAYSTAYNKYKHAQQELELLKQQLAEANTNEEFMRFQLNELSNANLQEDEQKALEEEQELASHTEEIKNLLYETNCLLNEDDQGIVTNLHLVQQKIAAAAAIYPKMQPISDRLDSLFIDIKDISQDISSETRAIDFNPERLASINERLDLIYSLERKFKVNTTAELLKEQQRLQDEIDNIDNGDEAIKEKEEEVQKLFTTAKAQADALTDTRKKVVTKIQSEIKKRLSNLGMPNVEFGIDIQQTELGYDGQDKVSFLFSANKGMEMRPVAKVASGGEISRLMLSLKAMISNAVKLPTIIFDEIDTGVSGRVAEQMAAIMQEMGKAERQVISITHLPQIAALGTHHYKVEKHDNDANTTSVMRMLSEEERVTEIAQMLSGSDITEAATTHARELLKKSI